MKLLAIVSIAASVFVGEANATSFKNVDNGVWSTGLLTAVTPLTPTISGAIDPHYQLFQVPAGCSDPANVSVCTNSLGLFGTNGAAFLVNGSNPLAAGSGNNGVYPLSNTWSSNSNVSQWIGPKADQVGPANPDPYSPGTTPGIYPNTSTYPVGGLDYNALYVYRLLFNLTALNLIPGTATISLGWSSDDNNNGLSSTDPNFRASSIRVCTGAGLANCTAVPNSGNNGYDAALTQVTINSSYFAAGQMALDFLVYNKPILAPDPSGLRVEIFSADAADLPEPGTWALFGLGLTGMLALRRKR